MPLLGGLLPGPPPLDSLEALGWRGILWLGPSRPPRSASAGPPPRAPPPLFLPEGRRAQASAARQRPGGSAGKLGALTLQPALGRPLMQEARQASFWTWSWKCFLLVGSLSPLCSTDIQDHRPRDWTPLRLHRAATLSCRARLQPLPPGHRLARSAAVAGLRWFWQWHQLTGPGGAGMPGPARPADAPQPGFSPGRDCLPPAGTRAPCWFLAPQPAVGSGGLRHGRHQI